MDLTKRFGVWGYGVTGKSIIDFLSKRTIPCALLERRSLTHEEEYLLNRLNVSVWRDIDSSCVEAFFASCDFVIPSPGIDIRSYQEIQGFQEKLLPELDFFSYFFHKPIIALTGTLGKTTTITLCAQLLNSQGFTVAIGGNIGIGLCDLIGQQDSLDFALLEVSSFQLEYTRFFSPTYALWTNFYPNHVDRHGTVDNYFTAKARILRINSASKISHAVVPYTLKEYVYTHAPERSYTFTHHEPLETSALNTIRPHDSITFIEDDHIVHLSSFHTMPNLIRIPATSIPIGTFMLNWVTLNALLAQLGLDIAMVLTTFNKIHNSERHPLPPYRLTHSATLQGAWIYNDSKSTVPQATLAAIDTLWKRHKSPLIILIGGISKGVDRTHFITQLSPYVERTIIVSIICFGTEASALEERCLQIFSSVSPSLIISKHTTLLPAIEESISLLSPNRVLLFSPAGASYDLFNNYQERGAYFDRIIDHYRTTLENDISSSLKPVCIPYQ